MSALTVYEKVDNPLEFTEKMGLPIAALCNCSVDQGPAMALVCLCEGITPLEAQEKYHFISGKPSMKYDAMLREFNNRGGIHTILSRTPKRAAIKLQFEGQEYEASYSWDQAQEDRWPWKDWKDHSKGMKDNWATPTDRKIMLFARLVSDTLKVFCPKVIAGIYTPEELRDIDGERSVILDAKPSAEEVMKKLADAEDESVIVTQDVSEQVAVDVPFEPETLGDGFASKAQLESYKRHCERLEVSHEQQEGWLKKRHAEHPRNLKKEQIQEMIDKLASVGN
jgi:hypothetical protein